MSEFQICELSSICLAVLTWDRGLEPLLRRLRNEKELVRANAGVKQEKSSNAKYSVWHAISSYGNSKKTNPHEVRGSNPC